MPDVFLFDLDGTLTDPGEGITNSVAYALEKFGIIEPDHTKLYPFIGPPLKDAFVEFYGFTMENSLKAVDLYREYFARQGIFENRLYNGIPETLRELKAAGKKLYLCTSKPTAFAERILEHFGLSQYFDGIAAATMDGSRSAKADVVRYALEISGAAPEETVMVGDRFHDIEGAKANSVCAIGVLYGYGSRKELENAGAWALAEQPEDLLRFAEDEDG